MCPIAQIFFAIFFPGFRFQVFDAGYFPASVCESPFFGVKALGKDQNLVFFGSPERDVKF